MRAYVRVNEWPLAAWESSTEKVLRLNMAEVAIGRLNGLDCRSAGLASLPWLLNDHSGSAGRSRRVLFVLLCHRFVHLIICQWKSADALHFTLGGVNAYICRVKRP